MKIISVLYNYARGLNRRSKAHKTKICLNYASINIREVDLKQKMVEEWPIFEKENLSKLRMTDWRTSPEPILKVTLFLEIELNLHFASKIFYLFFPNPFLIWEQKQLRTTVNQFLNIKPRMSGFDNGYFSFWKSRFTLPKSIHLQELRYIHIEINGMNELELDDPSVTPLLFEGKLPCFFRIYRLKKILYPFKTINFEYPFPLIGELYIKTKSKYKDGSYGDSIYMFQGRFLQNKQDQYLLSYWGLTPINNHILLNKISNDIFKTQLISPNNETMYIEKLNLKYSNYLEESKVISLLNSVDQVAIF